MLRSINPATGELAAEFAPHSIAEINDAVVAAHAAFEHWRRVEISAARGEIAQPRQNACASRREHCARLATEEMGKPITEARAEIEKCAWVCDYYAEHGPAMLADEPVKTEARESFITFQPLGVILAVMPWNFPFWQFFRAAAPILLGRQRAGAQARLERPALRAGHRESFPRGGVAGGLRARHPHRAGGRGRRAGARVRVRRDAHRQRRRRRANRRARRHCT